jgi:hypothetical protein
MGISDRTLKDRYNIVSSRSGRSWDDWGPPKATNGFLKRYVFKNGYEVSIVWHDGSYGNESCLFEAAIFSPFGEFDYDAIEEDQCDVYGWLDFQQVVDIINKVSALPDPRKVPAFDIEAQLKEKENGVRLVCDNTVGGE